MRKNPAIVLVAAALLAAAAYPFAQPAGAQAENAAAAAWEHLAMTHDGPGADDGQQLGAKINQLGDEGWQLVTVMPIDVDGTTKRTVYYFKRPKK